jgi:hypothetical protein
VRIAEVPPTLIDIHPEWRSDAYFVVRDEIVIIDKDRHVVAIVPTGASSGARLDTRGGAMNIGQAEIREIQIELNRMGFNVGEPDGRLGPRTKEALMAFQRQKGFDATGEIDRETLAALRSEGGQQGNEGKAVEASAAISRPPRARGSCSPLVISASRRRNRGQMSSRGAASSSHAASTSDKAQAGPPIRASPPLRVRAAPEPVRTIPRAPTPDHLRSGGTISKSDVINGPNR